MLNRKARNLEGFWPKGNKIPIMFVDVVGEEGQEIGGSKKEQISLKGKGGDRSGSRTKVGVDSKYNMKEAKLVVRFQYQFYSISTILVSDKNFQDFHSTRS